MGLLQWLKPQKKKEPEMAKTRVKFTYTDGQKVDRRGPAQVFNLKAPIGITLPPGSEIKVDLGVSCNFPLHVFETRGNRARGIRLVDGIWACQDAEENLVLKMKNETQELVKFDLGETLARCAILDNSNISDE